MYVLPYLLVIGAWLLPIVRVWVSCRKTPPPGHAWLVVTLVCFAVFSTTIQDGSTDVLARMLGRGTVYALCSLVSVLTLVALLQYQRLYQQTRFAASSQHIGRLHTLYRTLSTLWPVAGGAIVLIEGLWMRTLVDAQNLKPFTIILHHGPLVISRVIVQGFLLTSLWVAVVYPFTYFVWHRHQLDPAFREQGGHWRLACLAGTTLITIISGIVHTSTTVLIYLQPAWSTTAYSVAQTSSAILGPLLVGGLFVGCLPQRIFWSVRSYHLYRQLLPLHARMRNIITGIYLEVPKPRAWEVVLNPVQPIIGLSRLRTEITDARFMCYGEANTVLQPVTHWSSSTVARALVDVARYERGVLDALAQGETCPAEATYLSAISYQSLDYYLLLAKVLQPQRETTRTT